MKELIAVFIGSGLGGLTRFGLGKWVDSWHNHHFPFGTFVVNVVACFILGFVIGLADHKQIITPTARLFLAVSTPPHPCFSIVCRDIILDQKDYEQERTDVCFS